MAAPDAVRQLAAAAVMTLLGLACLTWVSMGTPDSPTFWTGAGVALLAASALLHWRSSRGRR